MEAVKEFKSYSEIKKQFVQNFFRLCDENQFTHSQIAKETGITLSNLHKYRYNNKSISEEKLFQMAKQCGISHYDVFTLQQAA